MLTKIYVYCDCSCRNDGSGETPMGIGVYVGRTVVGLEPFELERKAFQRVTTKIFERNWL